MADTALLQQRLGKGLQRKVNLYPYLTLRPGTVADYFIEVRTRDELIGTVRTARELNVPFVVVGGGSNIAPLSPRLACLVIKNNYAETRVLKETDTEVMLLVSSGYPMSRLVNDTVGHGWEGLEYHKGLPGSVGGAVFMNSKWTKPWTYVGDCLASATLLDGHGAEKQVERGYFRFDYDYSILQDTKETVIDVVFRFKKADSSLLEKRANESLDYRKKTQPFGVATAGCFFRNISKEEQQDKGLPTTSAGYLIDKAGLKGVKIGQYEVSGMHANFIINNGKSEGKPEDLLQLVKKIKAGVMSKFGINLKEEVVTL